MSPNAIYWKVFFSSSHWFQDPNNFKWFYLKLINIWTRFFFQILRKNGFWKKFGWCTILAAEFVVLQEKVEKMYFFWSRGFLEKIELKISENFVLNFCSGAVTIPVDDNKKFIQLQDFLLVFFVFFSYFNIFSL